MEGRTTLPAGDTYFSGVSESQAAMRRSRKRRSAGLRASAGPAPWYLFRITIDTAFGVATEEPHGATRWRFAER